MKKKAEVVAEPVDAGLRDGPAIRMEPGYGFDAWIENGLLQITQGESGLALTRTEAKVLFAGFEEWAS